MRFFIALEIPEQDREQLVGVQNQLKEIIPQISLTNPEKLHLTIAFIGTQPDIMQEQIIDVIKKAVKDITPFTVTPAYLDGFPHLHGAHILWVGVKGEVDKLHKLRHRIKDGLIQLNLPIDPRRYVPHIALGKINNFYLSENLEKKLEQIMSISFSPITVSSVKLFESIPEHGFHTHNTLAKIDL